MQTFEHRDEAFIRDPYAMLARFRSEAPVAKHPALKLFHLFRYADIERVLLDAMTYSSKIHDGLDSGGDGVGRQSSLSAADPPMHTRLRALVSKAFTPKRIAALETRVRELVRARLAATRGARSFELVALLSAPIPMIVISELLGFPAGDAPMLQRLSDEVAESQFQGVGGAPIPVAALEKRQNAVMQLAPYFMNAIEERRRTPRDDLVTALSHAEEAGDRLSFIEFLSTLGLLLIAGNETTRNLISNSVVLLSRYPEAQEALRAKPSLVPSAVEEALRFESSVTARMRRTTASVEICGHLIPAESTILYWISSGNRDEEAFRNPERFDISRDPNRHLSFGLGRHFCLGAYLARMEIRIVLEELLAHTTTFRVEDDASLIRSEPFGFRGVKACDLYFEPRNFVGQL